MSLISAGSISLDSTFKYSTPVCEYCVQVFSRASDQESCGWWRAIVKMIKGDFHVVEYLGNNFYAVLRCADSYSFISFLAKPYQDPVLAFCGLKFKS